VRGANPAAKFFRAQQALVKEGNKSLFRLIAAGPLGRGEAIQFPLLRAANGLGTIQAGAVGVIQYRSWSNEFANLIITQRSFQANAKIITTSDEMLQDTINLKR
jgi:flagellar hook protein FlgE